jgi:hypothetical protein
MKTYELRLRASEWATCIVEAENKKEAIDKFQQGEYDESTFSRDSEDDFCWKVQGLDEVDA